MKVLALVILSAGFSLSSWAQCLTPRLTPQGPIHSGVSQRIEFEAVEGADLYQIEVLHPNDRLWYVLGRTSNPGFLLPSLRLPFTDELRFRVIAQTGEVSNEINLCFGEFKAQIQADEELRRELSRAVIPVAGSVEGAFGSQWRTILSLSNTSNRPLGGKIIFHPAGSIASDQDPSMTYNLKEGEVALWPDIVTALGATGLGSIDIIPDETSFRPSAPSGGILPAIQVRVVNDSETGTYGTSVKEVLLPDFAPHQLGFYAEPFLKSSGGEYSQIIIPSDYEHVRINVGIRYFGFEDLFNIYNYDPQNTPFVQLAIKRGEEVVETVWREAPAGFIEQVPLEDIFESDIREGDVVRIRAIAALTYWTLTDNRTNDPSFFLDVRPRQVRFE